MKTLLVVLFISQIATAKSTVTLPVKAIPDALPVDKLVQLHDSYIAELMTQGLLDIGDDYEIKNNLAKEVKFLPKEMKIIIELKDVYFSDGDKVLATHVVEALTRCAKEADLNLSLGIAVRSGKNGITAISPSKIQVESVVPTGLFYEDLAHSNCHIVKPSPTGGYDLLKGAVGTGPYKLVRHNKNEIVLTRVATDSVAPEEVVIKPTNDYGVINKLSTWADVIVTENSESKLDGFTAYESAELGTYQLVFNNSESIFRSKKLRDAVQASINFDILADRMGWQKNKIQQGLFPFGIRGFKQRTKLNRQNEGRNLLSRLGYNSSNKLGLSILTSIAPTNDIERRAWKEALEGVPVKVNLEIVEQEVLARRRKAGEFEALRIIKSPGSVEGYRLLASYLTNSPWNTPRHKLKKCDEKIVRSMRAKNADLRWALFAEAEDCLLEENVLVPLASVPTGTVYIRYPWKLPTMNRYLLAPYRVDKWTK